MVKIFLNLQNSDPSLLLLMLMQTDSGQTAQMHRLIGVFATCTATTGLILTVNTIDSTQS